MKFGDNWRRATIPMSSLPQGWGATGSEPSLGVGFPKSQLSSFHICQFGPNHISVGGCITSCRPSSLCNFALLLQFLTVFRICWSTQFLIFLLELSQYFKSGMGFVSKSISVFLQWSYLLFLWMSCIPPIIFLWQCHISNWMDKILVPTNSPG